MFLYLVRHGEAKSEKEDPERALTDKGLAGVLKVAVFANGRREGKRDIPQPENTCPSDRAALRRTTQAGEGDGPERQPASHGRSGLWALRLAGMNEDIMLVGHLPYMARLAGLLYAVTRTNSCRFRDGGVVCLTRGGGWAVAWMIVPEMVA